jgi:hypothetical protein
MAMVNGSGRGCSGGSSFRLSFAGLHAVGIVAIVALLCWVCFFNGIDSLYPLDKTEALQLALADSMATGGDWVTPAIDVALL